MGWKDAIIAVFAILLLLSIATTYLVYHQQQQTIEVQETIIEEFISARHIHIETTDSAEPPAFVDRYGRVSSSIVNIIAIRSDTGLGEIGRVLIEITGGDGDVLVNTEPFIKPLVQYSVREAVEVAANFTGTNVSKSDITVSFEIDGTVIGGPSAGAATAVAIIAAMEGEQVRHDVAITGTIEEGGYIGQVAGVFEKAVAAEKGEITIFLVPCGQKQAIYYERQTEEIEIFGFTFTLAYYTPREVDLGEYMAGKMDVIEVATIGEAVRYMILKRQENKL